MILSVKDSNQFIPQALKSMQNWCAWKLEQRKGKPTKVPYQVNGIRASSTDRNTWTSFEAVSQLLSSDSQYNGHGFMVSDDIVFIDVDHCISDDGIMDQRGADILSAFPLSYAEISQSGNGLHILTRGLLPRNFNNRKHGVEMYSSARFCAITGNAIQSNEPTTEQDGITYVYNKYGKREKASSDCTGINGISNHSDRWVIAHASNVTGERGRDFQTLFFNGDVSAFSSASEADCALCVLLGFWCDRDQSQIDRLFRQSALYRWKWEREDYRNRTIIHACEYVSESFSEWLKRSQKEVKESASVMQFLSYGE